MADLLTLEELAQRSGVPAASLQDWQARGLVGRATAVAFKPEDVRRARLIRLLLRRGVDVAALAEAERSEEFVTRYLGYVPQEYSATHSVERAAERIGLDVATLQRFVSAAGLGAPDDLLSDEDVDLLRGVKVLLESGLPAEALVQLLRVYAEALGRVAEAEVRVFHFYVHERLRAGGIAGSELAAVTEVARAQMMPVVEPAILTFHRKGFARAVEADALLHLQEDTGFVIPGQLRVAVAFVDLASFTPLAEVMGDEIAADVLARFSHLVHEAVGRCDGRAVKQIGDAFMLVFSGARAAVTCVLDIERRTMAEPQFPAIRGGIQWGEVLYREGDYLGSNVNLAARLADAAQRHEVVVTAAVKNEAAGVPGIEFLPLGRRTLKGIVEEIDLFSVAAQNIDEQQDRPVDPVCGIELRPGTAVAQLVLDGEERFFCCATCLQLFVEAPERYRSAAAAKGPASS